MRTSRILRECLWFSFWAWFGFRENGGGEVERVWVDCVLVLSGKGVWAGRTEGEGLGVWRERDRLRGADFRAIEYRRGHWRRHGDDWRSRVYCRIRMLTTRRRKRHRDGDGGNG